MSCYKQLSLCERYKIFEGLSKRLSHEEIAKQLGRSTSTVSREVRRNSNCKGYYYYPQEAHKRSQNRKARHGFKVNRVSGLAEYTVEKLKDHWSPISIAGRWSKEHSRLKITHESIYAWIYSKREQALELPKMLPRAKKRRGFVAARKNKSHIPNRVSIHERPKYINSRSECGHFEADLMFNSGSMSSNVLTVVERKSRFLLMKKNESKKTDIVIRGLETKLSGFNVRSVTYDNGSEFSQHSKLNEKHGTNSYFCDPGSPWQKGSVENMNKLLRRFIPFNLAYHEITQPMLDRIAGIMNNIPRKCLNFKTPHEVFYGARISPKKESRVRLAVPAIEAYDYNQKTLGVALHY